MAIHQDDFLGLRVFIMDRALAALESVRIETPGKFASFYACHQVFLRNPSHAGC